MIQTFGDLLTVVLLLIAVFTVPRYVARNYGVTLPSLRFVMSRAEDVPAPEKAVAPPVAETVAEPADRIATPRNADNEPLPVDEVVPAEAREIIRRQAQVELLARLVNAQLVPLAKGIEAGFECKRASRPDSTYKQVRDALEPLLIDPNAPKFRQPDGGVGPATRPVTSGGAPA